MDRTAHADGDTAPSDMGHEQGTSPAALGWGLRQARESQGKSIHDVAHALNLMPRQVEAMEAGQFELLPGPAFVRGFLRNYARHLGVNIEDALATLNMPGGRTVELAPVTNAEGAMPATGGGGRLLGPTLLLVFVLLLALGTGWYFDWFRMVEVEPRAEREHNAVAPAVGMSPMTQPPPEATASVDENGFVSDAPEFAPPAPAPAPMSEADVAEPIVPEAGSAGLEVLEAITLQAADVEATDGSPLVSGLARLVFQVEGESWIQVRDAAGATVFSGTETAGTTRTVEGEAPLSVVVGNAVQVHLEHNGETIDLTPHTRSSGVARLELRE